jgi:hypothetical protein
VDPGDGRRHLEQIEGQKRAQLRAARHEEWERGVRHEVVPSAGESSVEA